jgi:hypothetical protein
MPLMAGEGLKRGESSGGVKALTSISRLGGGWRRVAGNGEMRQQCGRDQPAWGRRGS